jgi:hypothetical protein
VGVLYVLFSPLFQEPFHAFYTVVVSCESQAHASVRALVQVQVAALLLAICAASSDVFGGMNLLLRSKAAAKASLAGEKFFLIRFV